MSQVKELKDALKGALEQSGDMDKMRAAMRAGVFAALNGSDQGSASPQPCHETSLLNELIREYLVFNGFQETLSVFLPESGQPSAQPLDRASLEQQLRLPRAPNSARLPLLYSLLGLHQNGQGGGYAAKATATTASRPAAGSLSNCHR